MYSFEHKSISPLLLESIARKLSEQEDLSSSQARVGYSPLPIKGLPLPWQEVMAQRSSEFFKTAKCSLA